MTQIETLLSRELIAQRVKALGQEISQNYAKINEPLLLVCVLKGSVIFLADLCRSILIESELEFMSVSSYGDQMQSSGAVRINLDIGCDIKNRHVLVVEDIIDTGLTAAQLREQLLARHPASLKFCALLEKPSKNLQKFPIDYLGFQIEDRFVVGYGLDWAGRYRTLAYIGYVK